MWRVEDLSRALPKLVDLDLQSRALVPAHRPRVARAPVRQVVEHVVRLHRRLAPLLIPVTNPSALRTLPKHAAILANW